MPILSAHRNAIIVSRVIFVIGSHSSLNSYYSIFIKSEVIIAWHLSFLKLIYFCISITEWNTTFDKFEKFLFNLILIIFLSRSGSKIVAPSIASRRSNSRRHSQRPLCSPPAMAPWCETYTPQRLSPPGGISIPHQTPSIPWEVVTNPWPRAIHLWQHNLSPWATRIQTWLQLWDRTQTRTGTTRAFPP